MNIEESNSRKHLITECHGRIFVHQCHYEAMVHAQHQQNDKKPSAFLGFSGSRQAHKCAIFPKSQDYEAIWGPQLRA